MYCTIYTCVTLLDLGVYSMFRCQLGLSIQIITFLVYVISQSTIALLIEYCSTGKVTFIIYDNHSFDYQVHCTVYIVHCTVYIIQCTVYIVHIGPLTNLLVLARSIFSSMSSLFISRLGKMSFSSRAGRLKPEVPTFNGTSRLGA